jgi:hypothetical protein
MTAINVSYLIASISMYGLEQKQSNCVCNSELPTNERSEAAKIKTLRLSGSKV